MIDEIKLRVAAQRALLGEIPANLRGVVVRHRDEVFIIEFYYDGIPSVDDVESAAVVDTEFYVYLGEEHEVEHRIVRCDFPEKVSVDGFLVYHRREWVVCST